MNTSGLASLRFPASLLAGLGITTTLFWALWSFTDKTFEVVEASPLMVVFTRAKVDTPLETKERVKPERPAIEERIIQLPPIGTTTTVVDTRVAWAEPVPVTLPGEGIPIGRDSEPVPMFRVQPIYPPRAAANGTEGWVLVQFDIAASGSVTNVVALESEPGTTFDKAATDAVARWRYNPSVVNGQAVERVGVQTLLRFNLKDAE